MARMQPHHSPTSPLTSLEADIASASATEEDDSKHSTDDDDDDDDGGNNADDDCTAGGAGGVHGTQVRWGNDKNMPGQHMVSAFLSA